MAWALVVFVGILFVKPAVSLTGVPAPTPSIVAGNGQTQAQDSSDKASPQSAPATAPGETPAPAQRNTSQTEPPAKHSKHNKKKPNAVNCDPAPGTQGASSGVSEAGQSNGSATANAPAAGAATNCPPQKKIIRQGGTSEPSIQLAGGPEGQQASQQRTTASQMLEATQLNLKNIAGRQLSSTQQDMLTQIHEYVSQSKTATAAGELERARTLAWKAQMLSEELAKPAE